MDDLAASIIALKSRLAEQTGREMQAIRDLDRALARSDAELETQLEIVLISHGERRANIAAMLRELSQLLIHQPSQESEQTPQRTLQAENTRFLQ